MAAVVQPRILIQSGLTNSPIFAFSPVKRISGQTAKPSCMLEHDLAGDEQIAWFCLRRNTDDEDGGHDRDAARDQPAQPRRDADIEETFHHDLAGERAGERRVLPGSEQRHGEERARHADAEQRAEQLVGVLDFRHVLVSRPVKRRGGEHQDGGVDEEREHERDRSSRSWRT